MWDDLVRGCDRCGGPGRHDRLADCFAAVDYFEQRQRAVRRRGQLLRRAAHHRLEDVREALAISPDVPIIFTDATRAGSDQGRPARTGAARTGPGLALTTSREGGSAGSAPRCGAP